MKVRRSIFQISIFLLMIVTHSLYGQGDVITLVKGALNVGSSKELVKYLDKNTDLDFEGNKSTYSKTQAEEVLKDFFQNYPPSNFQIVHQGASRGGSPYVIGEYSYKSGSFRVWIRFKQLNESGYLVYAISFYKD